MCRNSVVRFRYAIFMILIPFCLLQSGCALQKDLLATQTALGKQGTQLNAQDRKSRDIEAALAAHTRKWKEENRQLRATQAELRSLLHELQDESRETRGRLEEVKHLAEISSEKSSSSLKNLDETTRTNSRRILGIEMYLGLEASEEPLPAPEKQVELKKDKKRPAGKLNGKQRYAAAKKLFDDGKYDTARDQFQIFLNENSRSKNSDNAQFWIGETYYHQKWYEKAILEYQKVIEKYPKGNKVPSALLKQGLAFHHIKDTGNARLILKELVRKFPASTEARIAKKKLSGMK